MAGETVREAALSLAVARASLLTEVPNTGSSLGARAVLLNHKCVKNLRWLHKKRFGAAQNFNGLREPHEPARKATPRVYLYYPLVRGTRLF